MSENNPTPSRQYQSIELDCPPGAPRPSDLLPGVLEGTGIVLDPEKPNSMSFGNWEWIIPEDQVEKYLEVKETIIAKRIKELYNNGSIRYGSW